MANTKLPARLLDTSAIPALNVTGDLTVDTTTLKVDSTNNRVGIGIASPSVNLEVIDPVSGNFAGAIAVGGNGSSRRLILEQTNVLTYRMGGTGTNSITQLVSAGSAGTGTVAMTIDESQNVGIGTASPDLTLHVDGANGYPATSGSTPVGHIAIRAKNENSSHGAHIGVANASPWGTWIQAQDANNLATTYPLLLNPNGGNVGIGTSSPTAKLHVDYSVNASVANLAEVDNYSPVRFGPFRADTDDNLYFIGVGGGKVGIQARDSTANGVTKVLSLNPFGGSVGIGTTSPGRQLEIFKAGEGGAYRIKVKGDTGHTGIEIENTSSNNTNLLFRNPSYTQELYMDVAGKFHVYNNNAHRFTVDQAGRVTMPYQPTWGASSLSNTSASGGATAGGTLVFSGLLNNNGNHYSNSTGLFTAPVAGQYFVTFSGLYDDSYNVTGPAYIRRNTTNLYRGYHQNSGSSYIQISMSGVVECSVGDTISIYSAMAGWHIGGETSFSGFLIG